MKPYEEFSNKSSRCNSIIFPENIFFWRLLVIVLDLCLADSRIFYFWYVLESIHKCITELHVLQCLFVRGSNKKQRRGRIISNITKRETFFISHYNQVLLGVISQCGPPSCTLKKGFPLPFSLAKKRIYLDIQLKAELTDLFLKLPGCSLFSRVGIGWWTLL